MICGTWIYAQDLMLMQDSMEPMVLIAFNQTSIHSLLFSLVK
jgi:hypothetical protein